MSSRPRPSPKRHAQGEVARLLGVAGQHQVAQAGQAHQGLRLGAQRHGEAGHFGKPAGDQGGARVVAEPLAANDAAGDGQHVLDGAAELGADDVVRRIDPEGAGAERHRQASGARPSSAQASVTAVGSSRATSAAKLGPVSTATGTSGSVCSTTSLSRAQVRCSIPLAQITAGAPAGQSGTGPPQGGAQMLGRHRQQDDVRRRHRFGRLSHGMDVRFESRCPAGSARCTGRARWPARPPGRAPARRWFCRHAAPLSPAPCPTRRHREFRPGSCSCYGCAVTGP